MADLKLGISGSEVTLPQISWNAGSPPGMPVTHNKTIDSARMSDGTVLYALFGIKLEWTITWNNLTYTELSSLQTIHGYNVALRFQNNWDSATWYNVVILSFKHDPKLDSFHRTTKRYTATIVLREL
jgi:hypothetical protein